jgi:hypothetical protein
MDQCLRTRTGKGGRKFASIHGPSGAPIAPNPRNLRAAFDFRRRKVGDGIGKRGIAERVAQANLARTLLVSNIARRFIPSYKQGSLRGRRGHGVCRENISNCSRAGATVKSGPGPTDILFRTLRHIIYALPVTHCSSHCWPVFLILSACRNVYLKRH